MSTSSGAHAPITPFAFIKKWKQASLTERQSAQEHFIDLCALFGHPTPSEDDPTGEHFAFEKGAAKVGGGRGFADVWKRNYFAWEYKRKNGNLDDALYQLIRYAPALESPPLQVVCDIETFRIHTAWTNTVPAKYELKLDDLADSSAREILRNVFYDPNKLKPTKTRAAVTTEAADKFSTIALRLQGRGSPEEIAHFINQLVFCFFANSVKLLPDGLFPRLLRQSAQKPERAQQYLNKLFEAMESGGDFDLNDIAWFNGGLFDGRRALRLDDGDIGLLIAAGSLDWSLIDPSIFGTLFERFLDPDKRAQIGAHYTDQDKISRIINPVILRPLREEWSVAKKEIERLLTGQLRPPMRAKVKRRMTRQEAAEEARSRYLERLRNLQILDPACGSGNFLYLALQGVKDIENRANLECEMLGLQPRLPIVGPEILRGIEINPMAAELARTTIWIGDIQWRLRNGIHAKPIPILRKLDSIECRNALIKSTASLLEGSQAATKARLNRPSSDLNCVEAEWPKAEFIVGNPPFLGIRLMRSGLGDEAVEQIFTTYDGLVSREADFVCYWFEKARAALKAGHTQRVGLVATNSIRGGANRRVLDRIVSETRIFEAWSDEPWVVDGAAVRVSLVCFGNETTSAQLDGTPVSQINADLTSSAADLTQIRKLPENRGVSFMGDTKGGAFDVPGDLARAWLQEPLNPNRQSNDQVLSPWRNGQDLTRRPSDRWIIDFGWTMNEREASFFEAPFQHIREHVLPERRTNRRDSYRVNWWRHVEPRPALRNEMRKISRYICTPRVAKHRLFVWLPVAVVPDSATIAIMRDDDTTFGILHSRFHEAWSLRSGTWLGVGNDPRYTPTTTFETFPFPEGLAPNIPSKRYAQDSHAMAIARASKRLDDLRKAWLNPSDLIRVEPEVARGYPERILAKDTTAAAKLGERTLTLLYNENPHWLVSCHRELDAAVAAAYGWAADIPEDEALAKLLALNLARAPSEKEVGEMTKRKSRRPTAGEVREQPQFTFSIKGGSHKQKNAVSTELPSKKSGKDVRERTRGKQKSA
jgi:type II restriction/modification system DNA methylase subunit YeeA